MSSAGMAQLQLLSLVFLLAATSAAGLGVPLKRGWNLGNTLEMPDPWHCTHPPFTGRPDVSVLRFAVLLPLPPSLRHTLRRWPLELPVKTERRRRRLQAEWVFESVAAAGFDWTRIPAHWGCHTAEAAPYAVDPAFMAQLNTTVGWALAHGLRVMVNTHHENSWIDDSTKFAAALPRLVAIWEQIAAHFSSYPDDRLVFELLNELQGWAPRIWG